MFGIKHVIFETRLELFCIFTCFQNLFLTRNSFPMVLGPKNHQNEETTAKKTNKKKKIIIIIIIIFEISGPSIRKLHYSYLLILNSFETNAYQKGLEVINMAKKIAQKIYTLFWTAFFLNILTVTTILPYLFKKGNFLLKNCIFDVW